MIIRTILVMSFTILQHCRCARSSTSGFRHFQPKSVKKNCVHRYRRSAAALQKIRIVPHNYPWVSAQNNHEILAFVAALLVLSDLLAILGNLSRTFQIEGLNLISMEQLITSFLTSLYISTINTFRNALYPRYQCTTLPGVI